MCTPPQVFMSYSHDSKEHKMWVLKLATDLHQHMGINVILDQWDLRIGADLPLFMEQGLSKDNLVLCVCSEQYAMKADSREGGVGYENMIISAALMRNALSEHIIPIIRANDTKTLPCCLRSKVFIDFSEDTSYLFNLESLVARIYGEDVKQKPPLGQSPYANNIARQVILKTALSKSTYQNLNTEGATAFNFKNNSGLFVIGSGEYEFVTAWSAAGADSVHAYSDKVKMIGYRDGVNEFPSPESLESFDYTSRVRTVGIGEVLVWMNAYRNFATTLITDIKVKSRGASEDILAFSYKIYK